MKLKWRRILYGSLILLCALIVSFYSPLPKRLHVQHSTFLLYRDGTPAHVFLAPDERWRIQANLKDIDKTYIDTLLGIEDKRFFLHTGFDPISITRAVVQNIYSFEIISGASTITMQLVRVLEPRPRTFRSKMIETWRSMQLEYFFSKDEILEMYLTFIPFGRNIEGIEAGSLAYFGHRPNQLEPHEIAILIAVPQNPNLRYPDIENRETLLQARDHIANLMWEKELIPHTKDLSLQSITSKPVPIKLEPFPREIPHLAMFLRSKIQQGATETLTLDKDAQKIARSILQSYQENMHKKGIENGCVLLADKTSGEYRAMVGGFDFWDDHEAAEIPAFFVRRSSGSTLKPFLYAMGIDDGLMSPNQKVEDVPIEIAGYKPRNYDENFVGMISYSDALSQSLNIPFVLLLKEIGLPDTFERLQQIGIRSFVPEIPKMGLSAAVGIDLTPMELLQGYVALANQGKNKELYYWNKDKPTDSENFVFSPQASWLTSNALRQKNRPDFAQKDYYTDDNLHLAWKTGTSFGFHDAWSVGYAGDWVGVVWLGNLSYRSSANLIGARAAGPILFDIMEKLHQNQTEKNQLLPEPYGLSHFDVCSYSGLIPNPACPHRERSVGKTKNTPQKICHFHQYIEVDKNTQLRVSASCRQGEIERRSILIPSSDMLRWSKIPSQLPDIHPACYLDTGLWSENLQIHSPKRGQHFILLDGIEHSRQRIPFEVHMRDDKAPVFWYVDGEFVAQSTSSDVFLWEPTIGKHRIVVTDGRDQMSQVHIFVEEL